MRVLICGSREWRDEEIVDHVLDGYWAAEPSGTFVLIQGGANGADACARGWALRNPEYFDHGHAELVHFPADWDRHGRSAGPIRNQQMLDEGKPDVVIAFKDGFQRDPCQHRRTHLDDGVRYCDVCGWAIAALAGRTWKAKGGTEDMVRRAKAAGIPTYIVSHA